MKNKFLAALFAVFLFQHSFSQTQQLTINQAVERGMQNSKQLKMDTITLLQTQIKKDQINNAALPNISLNAGYTRLSPIDPFTITLPNSTEPVTLFPVILNSYQTRASISESVFNGWKLKYTQESYNYLTQATQLDVEKDRAEVKLNIMTAFISYAKLKMSQQIVAENAFAAKQRVTEITTMRDKGIATNNDVMKAQLYESNIAIAKSDIDNSISISEYNLCILLGYPTGTKLEADTTGIFSAISLLNEAEYEALAFAKRNEVQSLTYRTRAAESNVKAAHSVYYPSVGVGANYYFARPNQRIIPMVDEFRSTWDVGVTLSWNITNLYTGKATVQDAQVQLATTQMQTEVLNDNIRMEVFQQYATCQNAIIKIKLMETAVQQAEENSRQVKVKFDNQTALTSDVLDADAALLQARINLILQKADAQLAYNRLLKSSGTLN